MNIDSIAAFGAGLAQGERFALPTMGQMINSQTGIETPAETQDDMRKRYAADL